MKKSMLTALLLIIVLLVAAACGRQTAGAGDAVSGTQEMATLQESLVGSLITNPKVIFTESGKDMSDNKGENITVEGDREAVKEGIRFSAAADENPFMTFAKSELGTTGNQAFYVMVLPSAKDFGFVLSEETGVGITIGDENEPCFFLQNGGYIEPITTDLRIEPGNWYHILLAIDTTGAFQGVICKDGALEKAAYFSVSADKTEGEDRVDKSWALRGGFHGEATLTIGSYCLYTFDQFVNPAE